MDLHQLKYFVKIVERRNFTKAARDCNVSQPALSQQIRKLERELGVPLLERKSRNINLTMGGELFLQRARKILQIVEDTKSEINDDGETGRLVITAIPTIGPDYMPGIIKQVAPQFPKADFLINEETTEQLVAHCIEGEIDMGIVALPCNTKRLNVEPLFEEELLVALPRKHRLAGNSSIEIGHLRDEPIVMLSDVHCLSDVIESFFRQQCIEPNAVASIQQLETAKRLVAQGHGISFIPEMATHDNHRGGLVFRPLHDYRLIRTIALCWNSSRYQSQLLGNVIKAIRELGDPNITEPARKRISPRVKQDGVAR